MKQQKHQRKVVTVKDILAAHQPEFHAGIRAFYSARHYGLRGILAAVTKNGRTIVLPQ